MPPTSLSKLPRARGGARRAGVDRRAGSGTTSTDALIIELTEQECRAALLILVHARTSLACDVGSTVEDATCPAMPSTKEQIADHLAKRWVRLLIQSSRTSQARNA